ncbi:MAG TPA: response regulator [Opitutaceae bacterium]
MAAPVFSEKPILYAEDEENDTFFMQRAFIKLERPEMLYVVGDGNQAVDYLEALRVRAEAGGPQPLKLLLLDVKMPYRSGLEVLEWVRQFPVFDSLLTVMLTSSTADQDIAFAAAKGANAYLVKPNNADDLITLIDTLLSTSFAQPAPTGRLNLPGNELPL